jgi:hypothetical protein
VRQTAEAGGMRLSFQRGNPIPGLRRDQHSTLRPLVLLEYQLGTRIAEGTTASRAGDTALSGGLGQLHGVVVTIDIACPPGDATDPRDSQNGSMMS